MDDFSGQPAPAPRWVRGALSGIQAGVFGALVIVLYMAVISLAGRGPWWDFPNILATAFYGPRALRGPGWPTVAGVALQVIAGGLAGALFGAVFARIRSASRRLLLGVIWGISWFYILQGLSRVYARLVLVYTPELALLGAHTVFGLILGWTVGRHGFLQIPEPEAPGGPPDTPPPIG